MSSSRPPAYIIVPLILLVLAVGATAAVVLVREGSDSLVGTPASDRAAGPDRDGGESVAADSGRPGESAADLKAMREPSWGVTIPRVPGELKRLDRVARVTGRAPDRVMWYAAWSEFDDFPTRLVRRIARRDALPEISWEPWDPAGGLDQPRYAMSAIAAGQQDRYLRRWARQARAYGDPVVIRFAHAMNGDWYPWGAAGAGTGPAEHRAAWRHVVEVFRDAGADNVIWSWSPNIPYEGAASIARLFPGDEWVDRVALDGYNWAGYRPGTSWRSFEAIMSEGLDQLEAVSDRPAYIAEVGCPQRGDKAAWVSAMFEQAEADPRIRGLTWFDFRKRADWRIDSSRASAAAFRRGLRDYGAEGSLAAGS